MDGVVSSRHLVDVGVGVAECRAGRPLGGGGKKTLVGEQSVGLQSVAGPGVVLSVAEIRRLFWRLVLRVWHGVEQVLGWSKWRRRHQWIARWCHYRRRQNRNVELQL